MRGLPALFHMIASSIGLNTHPIKALELKLQAGILAEDQGIWDGMAGRNIPVALAVNDHLAGAWASGYEIGLERKAAAYGGLSATAALQLVQVRRIL